MIYVPDRKLSGSFSEENTMRNYKKYTCSRCGEEFGSDEVEEWRKEKEKYSMTPFLCPDCFDALQRMDLEDQIHYLTEGRK